MSGGFQHQDNLWKDTAFPVSVAGMRRLRAEACAAGMSLPKYFRAKAANLVRYTNPKFDISGNTLARQIGVALPPHVLAGLQELCGDLGVPLESAGELVACASVQVPL